MPVLPKPTERQYTLVPAGNHVGICFQVVDLGTQVEEYQGSKSTRRKVRIAWELPEEKMDDQRPFMISQKYTWSMQENAKLRAVLESWRGVPFKESDFDDKTGFDIKQVLGKACMINIVHVVSKNGRTYSNITAVTRPHKSIKVPPLFNQEIFIWLTPDDFDKMKFDALPHGLKQVIAQSPEFAKLNVPGTTAKSNPPLASAEDDTPPEFEDDIPL